MKKILITGGKGFIAKNLQEHFSQIFCVDAPAKQELDLLDSEAVFRYIREKKFDVIIHAATYDAAPKNSNKDPSKVLENNLRMFFNITRCRDWFDKLVFFGSGAEFGRNHWLPEMSEEYFDSYVPSDQYGFSKYIMTRYAIISKNIINLRLFAVFGKYEDWRYRVISNYCCKAVLGLPIVIPENKKFDFLYVDDLVKIVKWFIDNSPTKNVYNVCTGSVTEFKAIAAKIVEISGKNIRIDVRKENSVVYGGDNSLLLDEMKNFQFTPLDTAIENLYRWYETQQDLIKKEEFHY